MVRGGVPEGYCPNTGMNKLRYFNSELKPFHYVFRELFDMFVYSLSEHV